VFRFAGSLSGTTWALAQVRAAPACYYANQEEIDRDQEAEARETEALER
jgi:hypothetical protein